MDSGSLSHFFHHCGIGHFRNFLTQSLAYFFAKLGKMTFANKAMNPQHFGSNPEADQD